VRPAEGGIGPAVKYRYLGKTVHTVEQVLENCKAGTYELEASVRQELEELAAFDAGYSANWIALNGAPQFEDVEG